MAFVLTGNIYKDFLKVTAGFRDIRLTDDISFSKVELFVEVSVYLILKVLYRYNNCRFGLKGRYDKRLLITIDSTVVGNKLLLHCVFSFRQFHSNLLL